MGVCGAESPTGKERGWWEIVINDIFFLLGSDAEINVVQKCKIVSMMMNQRPE